jgi:intracellular septation protein A
MPATSIADRLRARLSSPRRDSAAQLTDQGVGAVLKRLALDVLSGWLFLAVFLITGNIYLSTGLGLATGLGQALWMLSRRQKVDPIQWMALALVLALGTATILTRNPTFVVLKPSIFEGCIALMMLRPGWLLRYSPSFVRDLIPRLLFIWGYLWAVAWLALAASNLVVAHRYGLKTWAIYTNISPLVLWGILMGLGFLVFPPVVRRVARSRGIVFSSKRAVS